MPYIDKEARTKLLRGRIEKAGELNFLLSRMIDSYFACKGVSYQTFNDVAGVLSALDFELKRRFLGPYEDTKIAANGEVFHYLDRSTEPLEAETNQSPDE